MTHILHARVCFWEGSKYDWAWIYILMCYNYLLSFINLQFL